MVPIEMTSHGAWDKTVNWMKRMANHEQYARLDRYGQAGVDALSNATPRNTGATAESWFYRVSMTDGRARIDWYNSHEHEGVIIAILIQYGHGTGTGGYVQGYDFINPALRPIFDQIIQDVWKEVTS